MLHRTFSAALFAATIAASLPAAAHFGLILPDPAMVLEQSKTAFKLDVSFIRPMEASTMTMVKPAAFYVVEDGRKTDLTPALHPGKLFGRDDWTLEYKFEKPGVYQFVVEPLPYWEQSEDKFYLHYTKVIVPALGAGLGIDPKDDDWSKPVGMKTEIVPLTRPYGNYAGTLFQGRVLVDGKSAPNTTVKVEFLNESDLYQPRNSYYTTQVMKTDDNGIFTFAAPWAGWWGFAAVRDAGYTLKVDGVDKPVEMGAVLWTEFGKPMVRKIRQPGL